MDFILVMQTLHEILLAIQDFKTSGKKVYAFITYGENRDYLLCSVADKIYMNPSASAGFIFSGIGASITFYKDLLNKVGVDMYTFQAGKYKGAAEPYSRSSMSPEVRSNLQLLFSDIYNKLIADIAKNRKLDHSAVRSIFENRQDLFINQKTAIQSKLVDELCYEEDFYNKIHASKDDVISVQDYSNPIAKNSKASSSIAVVYANGEISTMPQGLTDNYISSKKLVKLLDELVNDSDIKAIVLRVNSPGGSALESDIIWDKISKVKKIKPIVVSMGDVAASGGYYISCNANWIIADPYTITGSIGVISMFPNASRLANRIGVHTETVGEGKFLGINNLTTAPNPDVLKSIYGNVMQVYGEFKERVHEGRKIDLNSVEDHAQGQVWSAPKAESFKLVDQVATLDKAVEKAAELAKVKEYTVNWYPKQKELIRVILEDKLGPSTFFKSNLSNRTITDYLQNSISKIQNSFKEDRIQARMPYILNVN